jgi:hypothetical protein
MATLTGHLVADTYRALLKLIDNDILTASEKQISDGFGGGSNVFIDQNGFLRAAQFKVTGGNSSQFLKGNGSLDNTSYLPTGTTTSAIAEGSRLYFTTARVLNTTLTGFVATAGTVTASDTILTAIDKIWWNIVNGGGGGGGYVPYTGATQNLNLGTYGLISDFVQFNTTNSAIPVTAGTMSWNNTDGTADLKLKGGNVTLQVGQEQVTRVVNKTGVNLLEANYQAVYISGAQGQRLKVDLALATTDGTSAGTLGLVTENINNNQEGFVTSSGLVNEIDTTGDLQGETWADGDILYLSPLVAGDITNVKPLAPDHTVIIGFVVYAHAIHGKIYVKVDNGYEIEELHDVQVIDRTDEDILQWYEDDLVWRNINLLTAITNAGGISGLGDINYVPKFDTVNSITNSLIYDDGIDIGIATISPTFPADRSGLVVRANGVNSSEILLQSSINTDATIQGLAIANIFDEGGAIYQRANQHLRFGTNNLERMRLTESGYLAIGLTAPSSIIHAKDSTAYGKIIIDNNGATGGGSFSARQNSTETAIFGVSGSWQANTTSDAAIVATRASQGIKFYTNGSTTAKGGIDSVGNSFIGQLPAYYTGATNFIVQGISAGAMIGVTHADNSIKGIFSTLNSGVSFGSYTPHPVIFRTDDIESARIASDGKWLIGTNVNDNVNLVQINGSVIATTLKKSGGTSIQFLKADGSITTLTASAQGIDYDSATGDFYITTGYVIPLITTTTNWDTAYTNRITSLTTIGSSGNATLISNVLNIPTVTLSGIGGQPISANLTSLSGLSYVSGSFVKMTAAGTFTLDTNTYYLASNPSSFISLTALSSSATGLTYTNTTGVFSLTAGYVIPTTTSATNWDTAYTNRITSATAPLSITTNVISISQASGSTNGYLSSTDWTTFNNKSNTSGTVTSVSGAGTVSGLTLTGTVTTTGSLTLGGTLSLTSLNVTTALGFTPVTNARTLTINGTAYDLTADRSWTISAGISALTTTGTSGPATLVGSTLNVPNYSAGASAVRNVSTFTATSGQTTFTIIGGYTVGLIDVFINGARLSTVDFTATNSSTVVLGTGAVLNDIVDVVNYTATFTAGISGTGTANFLTKWTGTSTVSNSLIFDNGTNVGIGTVSPSTLLHINGTARISSTLRLEGNITVGSDATQWILSGVANGGAIWQKSNGSAGGSDDRYLRLGNIDNNGTANYVMTIFNSNVGIGTTAPTVTLDVTGAAKFSGVATAKSFSVVGTNGYSGQIIQQGDIFGSAATNLLIQSTTSNGIGFLTNGGTTFNMFINSSGNVGVGTTSPSYTLDIVKAATNSIRVQNTADNTDAYLQTQNTAGASLFGINATGPYIYTAQALAMQFYTNNIERVRITSGGKFFIGTTSGSSATVFSVNSLHCKGEIVSIGDQAGFFFENRSGGVTNSSNWFGWYNIGGQTYFYNPAVGNIATINSSSGAYTALSDVNKKKDFEESKIGLNEILKLKPKLFRFKTDYHTEKDLGFIAQDVKEFIPQAYIENGEGNNKFIGLNQMPLIAALTKAVQELKSELDQLKAK